MKIYALKYPFSLSKMIYSLISAPEILSQYIRNNIIKPLPPLKLKLPWISYAAISELEGLIGPEKEVFEYGSGGSTFFFEKSAKYIKSLESNCEWFNVVNSELNRRNSEHVNLIYCNYDFRDTKSFYSSGFAEEVLNGEYDIIMIDCKEIAGYTARPFCFRYAEKSLKKNGIIVLDDSWRYPDLKKNNNANYYREFTGPGPGRKGLTETTIFYY